MQLVIFRTIVACAIFVIGCVDSIYPKEVFAQQNGTNSPNKASRSPAELFLFYPAAYPYGNWIPTELNKTDVEFSSADGTKLHGWMVGPDKPKNIILFCHGNAGNVTHRTSRLKHFEQKGYAALVFDYRGYGKSEGIPTIEGVLADADAAMKFLQDRFSVQTTDIIIHGRSLGGAVAVQLAKKHKPKALILESTFTSFQDAAKFHWPNAAWLVKKNDLNSLKVIDQIKAPLLISHGDADQVIPFDHGRSLFKQANRPKTFCQIKGAGHAFIYGKKYYPQLESFIDDLK